MGNVTQRQRSRKFWLNHVVFEKPTTATTLIVV
jgi:hypothetical protein